jgi:hypothetical protein
VYVTIVTRVLESIITTDAIGNDARSVEVKRWGAIAILEKLRSIKKYD